MEPKWRNFFENTATVQFDHRCLAYASTGLVAGTFLLASRNGIWTVLPAFTRTAMTGALGMVGVQVALGISTLLLYVPIELAAAHQVDHASLLAAHTRPTSRSRSRHAILCRPSKSLKLSALCRLGHWCCSPSLPQLSTLLNSCPSRSR